MLEYKIFNESWWSFLAAGLVQLGVTGVGVYLALEQERRQELKRQRISKFDLIERVRVEVGHLGYEFQFLLDYAKNTSTQVKLPKFASPILDMVNPFDRPILGDDLVTEILKFRRKYAMIQATFSHMTLDPKYLEVQAGPLLDSISSILGLAVKRYNEVQSFIESNKLDELDR